MPKSPLKPLTARIIFVAVAAVTCGLDQLTKYLINGFMASSPKPEVSLIPGFLNIVHRYNTGGAFSLGENSPGLFIALPSALIAVLFVMLMLYGAASTKNDIVSAAGISLMLGGACGNMIDRLRVGQVFDFIDMYVGKYHWPAYNLADSAIVIGILIFTLSILRSRTVPSENADIW